MQRAQRLFRRKTDRIALEVLEAGLLAHGHIVMTSTLTACDGTGIPVDPGDAERLRVLLAAGVRLQVHRPHGRPLRVILREYLPDGTSSTLALAKAIMGAGPHTEVSTIGDPLDHRRANLRAHEASRRLAWRSKALA